MSLIAWQRAAILAGLIIVVIIAWGIARTKDDIPIAPPNTQIVIAKGGAEGHRFKTHNAEWDLAYDTMTLTADQSFAQLDGVRNGTYYRKGKPYLKIKAKHITVNVLSDDFTSLGPTTIRTLGEHPRTFTTDSVSWVNSTQKLELVKPVEVREGGTSKLTFTHGTIDMKAGDIDLQGMTLDFGG